jgi:hypothetical protein
MGTGLPEAGEEGEMESCLIGVKFQFYKMKKF